MKTKVMTPKVRPAYCHVPTSRNGYRASLISLGGLTLISFALFGGTAHADENGKMFTVSGFGTLGVVQSSNSQGDYVGDLFQPSGVGNTRNWGIGVDTKAALQIDGKFNEQFSAVLQIVTRSRSNNTYSPAVEWANLRYAITPDLQVRLGRTALPIFMVSDTRQVGFANPWIRTPIETYSTFTITNSDGADVSYRKQLFGGNNTTQLWFGKTKVDVVGSSGSITRGLKASRIIGVSDSIEFGALTARASLNMSKVEIPVAPGYQLKATSHIADIGVIYDPGKWFIQGEVSRASLDNLQRTTRSEYVTAGYRLDKVTPYFTISRMRSVDDQVKLALRSQSTVSAGVRWDFMKNMALKVQLDQIRLDDKSTGLYTRAKPGLAGSNGKVLAVALDFVY